MTFKEIMKLVIWDKIHIKSHIITTRISCHPFVDNYFHYILVIPLAPRALEGWY